MFQIQALSPEPFAPLFAMSDADLAARGALRRVADAKPGFPAASASPTPSRGETLVLVNFEHHPADTPFRASHAIYVRAGAVRAAPPPGEVPTALRSRVLSLRAFDSVGLMIDADLVDGAALEPAAERLLADPAVAYLHAHFAKPGCFAARIDRA